MIEILGLGMNSPVSKVRNKSRPTPVVSESHGLMALSLYVLEEVSPEQLEVSKLAMTMGQRSSVLHYPIFLIPQCIG